MKKISKPEKKFRLRQLFSYGLGAVAIGTTIGVPAAFISSAKKQPQQLRDRVKKASHDERIFLKKGVHPKQELFIQDKTTKNFKVNKNILNSFYNQKPFGLRTPKDLDKEIPKENPKKYNQMYFWNVNGVRMWATNPKSLNKEVSSVTSNDKHFSKDYVTSALTNKTFDTFMGDLQKEIAKLPSSYLANSAINFWINPFITIYTSYSNTYSVNVWKKYLFNTKLVSVITFALESISKFIYQQFNPLIEKGVTKLTKNQEIAQKLTSVPNSFVPGLISRAGGTPELDGINKFLNTIKESGILDMSMDGEYSGNKFRTYLYKSMIQNAKFFIHTNLIRKLYDLATPVERTFINNNNNALSKVQEKISKKYEILGGKSGWTQNKFADNYNTARVVLPKNAKNAVENLFLRKGINSIFIGYDKEINISDSKTLTNVAPYYISKRYKWNLSSKTFINKYNPFVNHQEVPSNTYSSSMGFFWRTNKDRWFVKNKISNLKVSIENRILLGDDDLNENIRNSKGFSLTTNDNSYNKFKKYMKIRGGFQTLPKATKFSLFNMPPKARPKNFPGSNPDNWSFDDAKKELVASLQIPISYYVAVIKALMANSSKNNVIEIIGKSLWAENSPLRFNAEKDELKISESDPKPSRLTFSLFNRHNISLIVDKIWNQLTESDKVTPKSSIFGDSITKHDFAAAERLFMKHISKKSEIDKKLDGYFSQNVLNDYLKSNLSRFQIDQNGNLLKYNLNYLKSKLSNTSSYMPTFPSNIIILLTIATIMTDKDSLNYSSALEHWMNYYSAQGFEILNNSKDGLSNKMIEFAKEMLLVLNRANSDISFGKTVSILKQLETYQGYTMMGYSSKKISYINIENNDKKNIKMEVFEAPTNIFVYSKPGEKEYINSIKNKNAFFTRALRIGDYKDSQLIKKNSLNQSFRVKAFDSQNQEVSLLSVNSRPPIGFYGEISFTTILGLMTYNDDENGVFINTFKNAKGL